MAVRAEIKLQGIEALKRKLADKAENIEKRLDMELTQLAEEAVTYSKENKGYRDRTANLKNSISFALFHNRDLVHLHEGTIPQPQAVENGQAQVTASLEDYYNQEGIVAPKGYTLVIVAGMEYGIHVEHKGYNVLYLTKFFLQDEMEKIMKNVLEDMAQL